MLFTLLPFPGFLFTLLLHFFCYAFYYSRFFLLCRFWQYNVTGFYEWSSRVPHLFFVFLFQWHVTCLYCGFNQICNRWIKNRTFTSYSTPLASRESLVKVIKPKYYVIVIFQLDYNLGGIDIKDNININIDTEFEFCVCRTDIVFQFQVVARTEQRMESVLSPLNLSHH